MTASSTPPIVSGNLKPGNLACTTFVDIKIDLIDNTHKSTAAETNFDLARGKKSRRKDIHKALSPFMIPAYDTSTSQSFQNAP
jgi:hypothetical protein